jgi:hypothetical protein
MRILGAWATRLATTKLVVSVVVAIAALGGADSTLARRADSCSAGKTLLKNREVRVFKRENKKLDNGYDIYACLLRTRRATRAGSHVFPDGYVAPAGLQHLRLAGHFLAWDDFDGGGKDTCDHTARIGVMNVATRKTERSASSACISHVTSIELSPKGSVAWIRFHSDNLGKDTVEVNKLDRAGEAILDSDPAIDPYSLQLTGSTVTWKLGGEPKSATLAE